MILAEKDERLIWQDRQQCQEKSRKQLILGTQPSCSGV